MKMEITYNLSPELLMKMTSAAWKRIRIVHFLDKYGYLIAFAGSIIFFLLFVVLEWNALVGQWLDSACFTTAFALISLVLGLGVYHFLRIITIRSFRKSIARSIGKWPKTFFGEWQVKVSEQGITFIDPGRERFYRWEILRNIEQDDEFIFVYTFDNSGIIIPKSAFVEQQNISDFLNTLTLNIFQDSAKELGARWVEQSKDMKLDWALQKSNWCIVYALSAIVFGPVVGVFFGGLTLYRVYKTYRIAASVDCKKCIRRLQMSGVLSMLSIVGWVMVWVLML